MKGREFLAEDYTKQYLCATLKKLMQKKSINKINVSELCRCCGIERSTFYYHFQDKYDLLAYAFLQIFGGHDPRDKKQTVSDMDNMRKDILFYQNAYRDSPHDTFMQYLRKSYFDIDMKIIARNLAPDPVPYSIQLQLKIFLIGFLQICMDWIFTDDPIPTEELVDICYDAMPPAVRRALYFQTNSEPVQ